MIFFEIFRLEYSKFTHSLIVSILLATFVSLVPANAISTIQMVPNTETAHKIDHSHIC